MFSLFVFWCELFNTHVNILLTQGPWASCVMPVNLAAQRASSLGRFSPSAAQKGGVDSEDLCFSWQEEVKITEKREGPMNKEKMELEQEAQGGPLSSAEERVVPSLR